jgi:hypothetical protein
MEIDWTQISEDLLFWENITESDRLNGLHAKKRGHWKSRQR